MKNEPDVPIIALLIILSIGLIIEAPFIYMRSFYGYFGINKTSIEVRGETIIFMAIFSHIIFFYLAKQTIGLKALVKYIIHGLDNIKYAVFSFSVIAKLILFILIILIIANQPTHSRLLQEAIYPFIGLLLSIVIMILLKNKASIPIGHYLRNRLIYRITYFVIIFVLTLCFISFFGKMRAKLVSSGKLSELYCVQTTSNIEIQSPVIKLGNFNGKYYFWGPIKGQIEPNLSIIADSLIIKLIPIDER